MFPKPQKLNLKHVAKKLWTNQNLRQMKKNVSQIDSEEMLESQATDILLGKKLPPLEILDELAQ